MNDSAAGGGEIPVQFARAEAFGEFDEHCSLDICL